MLVELQGLDWCCGEKLVDVNRQVLISPSPYLTNLTIIFWLQFFKCEGFATFIFLGNLWIVNYFVRQNNKDEECFGCFLTFDKYLLTCWTVAKHVDVCRSSQLVN